MWYRKFARLVLLLPVVAHAAADALAGARFTVGDIQVIGLQRISEGTVFNYLPVNIGDELDAYRVREALRALHGTGFFHTVELRRDGATLVVVVRERPSIQEIAIEGNKDIKTEDLETSLRSIGLAAGKVFDRSMLEGVRTELIDQYFSQGKYAVQVETQVQELPGNLVQVGIQIKEGERARIRQISILGNDRYSDEDLLEIFALKTPRWDSWYRKNDRYSRESLQGDLERLRSWYLDRGFANFQIESAQVSIAPEMDDMFVTISIDEGDIYRIADVRVAGNTIVPVEEVRRLLLVRKGQIFSQERISATQQLIENRLGLDGYAFAEVDPVPRFDEEKKEVTMTFLVNPGQRVYVRRIDFIGTSRTLDVVFRREMRQLEGSWVSNAALERSKQRIARLPFIEEVEFETRRVEGTDDLVDVEFKVKEGPSASISGGLGYSESSSLSLQGSLADANFLGSGRRVSLDVSAGNYAQVYAVSHFNPYATINGVARNASASYSRRTQLTSTYSDFSTRTWVAGLEYGWPLSETQMFWLGASLQRAEYVTTENSSYQVWNWTRNNGGYRYLRESGGLLLRGNISTILEHTASWRRDSRNRTLFPTSGSTQSFSLTATMPGSGLEFLTASFAMEQYFRLPLPLLREIPLRATTTAGYGRPFGNTSALPPSRHWFVGGPDSVRGFRESTLGPRDSLGNPFGGDAALYGSAEAIIPLPRKWQTSARVSLFFDYGQAFYLGGTQFWDKNGKLSDTSFDLRRMRSSAGVSLQWLAPMGLFRFSYAVPLTWQRDTSRLFGDQRERFQFSIGSAF